VKPGARALGIAESYTGDQSTLAGVVVRASRVVDGFAFKSCAVGGSDATESVVSLFEALGRDDIRHLLVAGIAPAWFNLLDLSAIHESVDRPVLSISFEDSPGLESALREAFSGDELDARLATYQSQPDRVPVGVNDDTVYVRAVGIDDAEARDVVRAFTPEGGRPEPLRVARLAARAADEFR
jgi:endonuclease V-like protein UPF0215 family